MKNLILLFILSLMFSTTIFSQINFGFKGGVNYSNLHYDTDIEAIDKMIKESTDALFGYNIGAFLHVPFSKKIAFQPTISYSTQGLKVHFSETKLILKYLNLPLLFEYRFSESVGMQLGPTIGYLLKVKSKTDGQTVDATRFYENRIDSGISGGLFLQSTNQLRLSVCYYHGLRTVNKKVVLDATHTENIQNQNRSLQVGIVVFLEQFHN